MGQAAGMTRVAILAPMRQELAAVVKAMSLETGQVGDVTMEVGRVGEAEVVATTTGMGMDLARRRTEELLDATPVDHVMVVGIAGGVGPTVAVGDVILPRIVVDGSTETEYRPDHLGAPVTEGTIVSSDDFMVDPDVVAALVERGVIALDMETGAVAAVCAQRGYSWSVVRSISDMASDHKDDSVLGLAHPDGSPNPSAAVKYLLTHPWRIPTLARIAKGSMTAMANAANAAKQALTAA
jgi:nucleoside phosphorylase